MERKEETRKQSQLHSESETEEGTVGKTAGPQGFPIQPLFQASPLSPQEGGGRALLPPEKINQDPFGQRQPHPLAY